LKWWDSFRLWLLSQLYEVFCAHETWEGWSIVYVELNTSLQSICSCWTHRSIIYLTVRDIEKVYDEHIGLSSISLYEHEREGCVDLSKSILTVSSVSPGVNVQHVCLVSSDDLADPGLHLGDPGVDAGVLLLGAPDPPGDDTDLCTLPVTRTAEQGTTTVSTAWILVR